MTPSAADWPKRAFSANHWPKTSLWSAVGRRYLEVGRRQAVGGLATEEGPVGQPPATKPLWPPIGRRVWIRPPTAFFFLWLAHSCSLSRSSLFLATPHRSLLLSTRFHIQSAETIDHSIPHRPTVILFCDGLVFCVWGGAMVGWRRCGW